MNTAFRHNISHSNTLADMESTPGKPNMGSHRAKPTTLGRLTESCSVGNIIDIATSEEPVLVPSTPNAADRQRVADDILNKYRTPTSSSTNNNLAIRPIPLNPDLSQVFKEVCDCVGNLGFLIKKLQIRKF